ncbi:MAG: DEAD/DEAH box helicase family protein [Verrucomicrobiota bacterium]|nr:DEAD/DEAH box helicase family protein [Verrucomicrobiota bacterium]
MQTLDLSKLHFKGRLRDSQEAAMEVIRKQLGKGSKRLHIVAPPGSGKTVLGLYVWAEVIRQPALVISPNSAIQAQWVARTDLFDLGDLESSISMDAKNPGPLTSVTYQALTVPAQDVPHLEERARQLWEERLVSAEQAETVEEAAVWIEDLQQSNPRYYEERLSYYLKQARDEQSMAGGALETLHQSARESIARCKEYGIGLVILDECHHLMGHWGRVLAEAHQLFEEPVVLGLTATPPDLVGHAPQDIERYKSFFGPVDYEVPVPALVKEGNLAPYQDLAYVVRPQAAELEFIAKADREFQEVLEELADARPGEGRASSLPDWLVEIFSELRLPTGVVKTWKTFHRRDPDLADMGRLFLLRRGVTLPSGVPAPEVELIDSDPHDMAILMPVLDRYVRHGLMRSPNAEDQELAKRVIARMRMLGVQITETGPRPCASPVSRVLAYAKGKTEALVEILKVERKSLGDKIRAIVVTDYEKSSVTDEAAGLLDREAGGAVAAFRALLQDPETDALNPILVTGSTVLVDDDLAPVFLQKAMDWLAEKGLDVGLEHRQEEGFHMVLGQGKDWCPRTYVRMVTELFLEGVTHCLVGTRGLLGEGWDANRVNVLIDMTTITTSMSVNQLRGRSLRLDPGDPKKVANNWDIICVAEEFTKGLDDYLRFIARHAVLFGVTSDGGVEKGVGHVHPLFTEMRPEGIHDAREGINQEMLERAQSRDRCRSLWRIGEPYRGEPVHALEAKMDRSFAKGFPPFVQRRDPWNEESLGYAIGHAVLDAMRELGMVDPAGKLEKAERTGGFLRYFLMNASPQESESFIKSLHEAMAPYRHPRYVIPRSIDQMEDTWLSKLLPEVLAKLARKRRREQVMLHAVPGSLSRNKEAALVFQKYWNAYVSPGTIQFVQYGEAEQLVQVARDQGLVPHGQMHHKEVFY